ncbi:transglycosylase SLT domain-containing protein [candidate division KSB1 bacterium]|nr:transglycosylase SLT domain-containing protein [candidate division KSB1 bacterium]
MSASHIGLKKIGLMLAANFIIFSIAIAFYSHKAAIPTAAANVEVLSTLVQNKSHMVQLQNQRAVSLKKITDIISRYNRKMDKEIKQAIANEIVNMTFKYPNLNVDFILATITHESAKTWDPTVTSHVGAMGLMQIMPTTGIYLALEEGIKWTTAEEILFDPIVNIRLGCRYMSHLVEMYEHDGGLAAYNGGPRRAEMWLESNRNNNILYAETRNYVPAVLKLYAEYQSMDTL